MLLFTSCTGFQISSNSFSSEDLHREPSTSWDPRSTYNVLTSLPSFHSESVNCVRPEATVFVTFPYYIMLNQVLRNTARSNQCLWRCHPFLPKELSFANASFSYSVNISSTSVFSTGIWDQMFPLTFFLRLWASLLV